MSRSATIRSATMPAVLPRSPQGLRCERPHSGRRTRSRSWRGRSLSAAVLQIRNRVGGDDRSWHMAEQSPCGGLSRRPTGRGRASRCDVPARSAGAGGAARRTRSCHLAAGLQLHLPFSVRTAERLMAIARNPVLTKSDNLSLLPPISGTLLFAEPSRCRSL
jgi:hypothetical protein